MEEGKGGMEDFWLGGELVVTLLRPTGRESELERKTPTSVSGRIEFFYYA